MEPIWRGGARGRTSWGKPVREGEMAGKEEVREAGSSQEMTATEFAAAVDVLLGTQDLVTKEEEVCAVLAAGVQGDVPCEECAACLDEALKNPAPPRHQTILTASLLRLLAHHHADWLYGADWRQDVFKYLERSLPPKLLKSAGVERGQQTHEKLAKIGQAVDKWDDQYRRAVAPLSSLDSYGGQRQKIMSFLNGEFGSTLVQPFLAPGWEPPFGEYYRALERYVDLDSMAEAVKARSSFHRSCDELSRALNELPSRYSTWLADSLCVEGRRLFEEVFAENPFARPASLEVEWSSKKYKLYEKGAQLELALRVRNEGPGYAEGVRVSVEADESVLDLRGASISLGSIPPGQVRPVVIPATVLSPCESEVLSLLVTWKDFDGSDQTLEDIQEAQSQNPDIAWEDLENADPYSLEPVETADDLVGRKELLARLRVITSSKSLGSAIIRGQKRVGKTSIAKVIASELQASGNTVAYLEAGDFVNPDPDVTVRRLGEKLCSAIQRDNRVAGSLAMPDFEQYGLSALTDFLDDLHAIQPDVKVTLVVDEFDQLPSELYSRNPQGDSFFASLRSVSNRKFASFLLVGGEKMKRILDQQGTSLNKWDILAVDYFDARNDFDELVLHPTREYLEFSEDAVDGLYQATAGNPYYTNLVCQQVVLGALAARDAHVTAAEVERALVSTVRKVDLNSFQHFWEDGIMESEALRNEKSLHRRKVLIAVADTYAEERPAPLAVIQKQRVVVGVPSVETELHEFVARDVLVEETKDHFAFKVPLFERWLTDRGISELIQTANYADAAAEERLQQEQLRVAPEEIEVLLESWGKRYRGETLPASGVRHWLGLFGDAKEQRAMFSLLQATRFVTQEYLVGHMSSVDGLVRQGLKRTVDKQRKKHADVVVSYLDGVAKSGADIARLYADSARIYSRNIVDTSQVERLVSETDGIKVALFLDDFVGTGTQAKEYLEEHDELLRRLSARGIRTLYIAMIGHTRGVQALEDYIDDRKLDIELHAMEVVTDDDMVFTGSKSRFGDPDQRREAERLCTYRGKALEQKHPMGYGDMELALVFERGCPNNSLPVFWSDKGDFEPLFRRR